MGVTGASLGNLNSRGYRRDIKPSVLGRYVSKSANSRDFSVNSPSADGAILSLGEDVVLVWRCPFLQSSFCHDSGGKYGTGLSCRGVSNFESAFWAHHLSYPVPGRGWLSGESGSGWMSGFFVRFGLDGVR